MSQLSLRLPNSLHEAVKELAAKENVSANQFIATAVAEKVAALGAEDLLAKRAARAPGRKRFKELLRKAPPAEPIETDRL